MPETHFLSISFENENAQRIYQLSIFTCVNYKETCILKLKLSCGEYVDDDNDNDPGVERLSFLVVEIMMVMLMVLMVIIVKKKKCEKINRNIDDGGCDGILRF